MSNAAFFLVLIFRCSPISSATKRDEGIVITHKRHSKRKLKVGPDVAVFVCCVV